MQKGEFTFDFNGKCFCGSGERYKKCCFEKKPRYKIESSIQLLNTIPSKGINGVATIILNVNSAGTFTSAIDVGSGRIIELTEICVVVYGDRAMKKPKIYATIPIKNINAPYNGNYLQIIDQFDYIFGLDTNYKVEDGVYFTSYCDLIDASNDTFKLYLCRRLNLELISVGRKYNDREAVYHFLMMNLKREQYLNKKLAIVIDSDLEYIRDINFNKTPLYENYYLPPNVTLICAGSDTSTTPLNKLLKESDKFANLMLAEIKKKGIENVDFKLLVDITLPPVYE